MRPVLLCLLLLSPFTAAAAPKAEDPFTFQGVERVVAVGDVHGDVEAFKEVLRLAGLIDAKDRWVGGKAHLVQTGDIPDRGDHTRAALELLMRLETEARKAGGRVHALLGNHECMNMRGDLRYVTPGELASFADQSSTADGPGQPRGLHGHSAAYAPDGRYGKWLRTHPAVIRVNDTLFMHGGLAPGVPGATLEAVNRWVWQDLTPGQPPGGAVAQDGPVWFRGYALDDEAKWDAGLTQVLERFGARRMVMGHTPSKDGRFSVRFGGRVIVIDTGLSTHYGRHLSALELRGERATALYPEGRVPLLPVPRDTAAPRPAVKTGTK
ncbi:shewanella-like protein phosphatase [Corallococcus sp. BB11-1]|uniref:shewanella-like protein phosphatase n=1 Tax=Corallococcus sp. BB11-1 TaxID=2996783 RepID=UPI00226D9423|nr:shewanella-like protein phosphatase [Corallococcus sp. BB11-1]MCY1033939.1 shewanella-like protein phosphatase [Corallococcus sp. BB11-1]